MSEAFYGKASSSDPAPLGLAGFAFTTFILSFSNSGLFNTNTSADLVTVVVPLALFWGGLAQFVAGIFEMRKGNTFGFTAFCSYGAFWFFYGFLNVFIGMGVFAPKSTATFDAAVGLTLIFWGIFTFYMWIPAMHLNLMLNLTFLLLWITFILLGLGAYGGNTALQNLGGYVGLATAAVAAYGSFAIVTNQALGVNRIPLGFAINFLGKKS